MHNSVSIDMHLGFIQILFWGLKYRTYLNVHHKVNVVGLTGINISATNAISDIELEEYLTSSGVKLHSLHSACSRYPQVYVDKCYYSSRQISIASISITFRKSADP